MREQGAALVDVGGESTRPGATRGRPRRGAASASCPSSRALAARGHPGEHRHHERRRPRSPRSRPGPTIVNDVSGGLADAAMGRVVAETGVHFVAMHWRGGADVAAAVHRRRRRRAQRAQVAHRRAHRRRGRPGSRSSSTRASASRRTPSTTGSCSRDSASSPRSATASWSARRASGSSARCCPRARRPTSATCRPPSSARSPRRPASGPCACTTSPATRLALDVWRRAGRTERTSVNPLDQITLTGLRAHRLPRRLRARAPRRAGVRHRRHACTCSLAAAAAATTSTTPCTTASSPSGSSPRSRRDPVDLIETVAERVAAVALAYDRGAARRGDRAQAERARSTVPFDDVSVTIRRGALMAADAPPRSTPSSRSAQPRRPRGHDRDARATSSPRLRRRADRGLAGSSRRVALRPDGPDPDAPALPQRRRPRPHDPAPRRAARRAAAHRARARSRAHRALGRPHPRPRHRRATASSSSRPTRLTLPHPRAHERDFVLRPWLEVDPDAVLPGRGRVADLLAAARRGPHEAHPTRRRSSSLAVIGGVAGFLVQLVLAAASQPKLRPEYTLAITLAASSPCSSSPSRCRCGGRPAAAVRRHIDPFYATRVVVLAKASSLGGALLTGVAAGFLLELLVRSGSPSTGRLPAGARDPRGVGRCCWPPDSSPSTCARCRRTTTTSRSAGAAAISAFLRSEQTISSESLRW